MKLDRNSNDEGIGKYALLKLRKLEDFRDPTDPFLELAPEIDAAVRLLAMNDIIDWGATPETEFFVIRLKDKYAMYALDTYARQARHDDVEYGNEVMRLAERAGPNHPNCKAPD